MDLSMLAAISITTIIAQARSVLGISHVRYISLFNIV